MNRKITSEKNHFEKMDKINGEKKKKCFMNANKMN